MSKYHISDDDTFSKSPSAITGKLVIIANAFVVDMLSLCAKMYAIAKNLDKEKALQVR